MGINARIIDDLEDLKHVEWRRTWAEALLVKEGVYDEHGPIRGPAAKKE